MSIHPSKKYSIQSPGEKSRKTPSSVNKFSPVTIKWRVAAMAISGHVGQLKKVTLIASPADILPTLDSKTLIPSGFCNLDKG